MLYDKSFQAYDDNNLHRRKFETLSLASLKTVDFSFTSVPSAAKKNYNLPSSAAWQATSAKDPCESIICLSGIFAAAFIGKRTAGWNGQPVGGDSGLGTSPEIGVRLRCV